MPELLLHFAIPFALVAPVLGIRRALIVGIVAILPDLDVLLHLHRSFTHSVIFLLILIVLVVFASLRLGRGFGTVLACCLSLLSHPLLDLFHSPTPILFPLTNYSYHVSLKMNAVISDRIVPYISSTISMEETGFKAFQYLDAPIFTDVGFMASLILIATPSIYLMLRTSGNVAVPNDENHPAKPQRNISDDGVASTTVHPSQTTKYHKDDVTVLIPTLNEEEAIEKVIREVRECGFKNILVVDGYSEDRTVEIAKSMGVRVVYQEGHGKSMAIKTGIEIAQTPYILIMDGDGTYDPRDIELMLEKAVEKNYDEVIGYRVNRENIPLLHRLGNRVLSTVISLLMGQRVKDPCSGMYLLRTDFAKRLEITATGFDVEAEIVCQSIAIGRVAEVPVRYRKRIGKPKLNTWSDGLRIVLTALKISWLYNPVLTFSSMGSILGLGGLAILLWQLYMRYIFGEKAWSVGWTWLGLVLLIVGIQSFTIAIISLMLKRLERRIMRPYVETKS
jgi:glycosyltransferase involved in cell wall biosynthesis